VVSAADPPRSLSQFSRPEPLLFFQVAPHLSSQGLSGPHEWITAECKYKSVTVRAHLTEFTASNYTTLISALLVLCTTSRRTEHTGNRRGDFDHG
jgi:hypothetical protein